MDDKEKAIINKIDEIKDDIIRFHQKIVQIPSENPPGKYKELSKLIEEKMKEIGLKTKIKRRNIIGEFGKSNGGRSLIFNAHYDTVEKFKGWTKDPFGGKIENDRIFGRGASDDKSCVVAEIFATKALIDAGVDLKGRLTLTAVIDEEMGGFGGSNYLLEKDIVSGDACVVGDAPADYPIGFIHGAIFISFTIIGKQAHGFMHPDLPPPNRTKYSGISAIHKMIPIMQFLTDLQEEFNKTPTKYPIPPESPSKVSSINMAMIEGGTKISTVADKCLLHCSIQTIPEHDPEEIKMKILNFVDSLKRKDPDLDISVQTPISYGPYQIKENSDFSKAVKEATEMVYNEVREFKMFNCTTDAHWFAEKGMETVIIGTFREDNVIHCVDENVRIKDLIDTTKMFAMIALNYLK
ncbi:MAG: ArgE/DapE family deacylase [Candidatus Lokiarchaeota archaeon]|nr:ArgE/DapE family deacylase [Candidatus Lokiarchaeota archaeon]MBD3338723.1 ArgE/DapE family deacylase [Candidatus Lokiarchaeota archaeon]